MLKIDPNNIISLTEARANLTQVVARAENEKVALLTKRGKPAAILLDPDYFSFLQERLESKSWADQFDDLLARSRSSFKKYLQKQGYDPSTLTEEKVRQIIAEI
jgi:prevent-host-death family protein